ncbi:c-type cytochrome [Paracoccus sp. SY]|uniref:c-type cytochrome n=1 Tax=Paracoccus sp. SY TaxID=1330255 RepID=UPI000CD2A12D|nr:cytochrome c [Paracoccus sp. SY]
MRWHELLVIGATLLAGPAWSEPFGLGTPATPEQVEAWDISIGRNGENLPEGDGTVAEGKVVYEERCAAYHGEAGEGGIGDRLVGGQGTLATDKPVKTVGSYWPYAPTLFDYINRAMPMDAPQSLTVDEVYAVSAYLLFLNGIVPEDARMDAPALSAVVMPNRDNFVPDPRPDI